jgi:2'-5' RNA ligase
MARRRFAVALMVPEPWRTEVDALRRAVADPRLGRIGPHITLVPPVNIAGEDVSDALRVVRTAAAAHGPLELTIGPATTFLPGSPVAYLAVHPVQPVTALHRAVNQPPIERREERPFVPHVTLTTDETSERLTAIVTALAGYVREVPFEHVHLLEHTRDDDEVMRWHVIADTRLGSPTVLGRGGIEVETVTGEVADPEAMAFVREADVITARIGSRVVAVASDEAWVADLLASRWSQKRSDSQE